MGERETTSPNISGLSLVASRLLNLLLLGISLNGKPIEEIMHMVGTARYQTFVSARRELEALGFILVVKHGPRAADILVHPSIQSAQCNKDILLNSEDDTPNPINSIYNIVYTLGRWISIGSRNEDVTESVICKPHITESVTSPPIDVTESVICNLHIGLEDVTESVASPNDITESVTSPFLDATESVISSSDISMNDTTESVISSEDVTESVLSLLDRCIEVDGLDGSGEISQRNTPAQKRRLVQLPLVGEMWEHFIPGVELTSTNQKKLLSWCGNSLEKVYEELEYVASLIKQKGGVQYPVSYALATVERRSKDHSFQSASVRVPVLVGAAAYVPGGDYPEPSAEHLKEADQAKRRFEQLKRERGLVE